MHITICSVQKMVSECVIQIGVNLRSQEKKGPGGGTTIQITFITSHTLILWHSQIKTGFSADQHLLL